MGCISRKREAKGVAAYHFKDVWVLSPSRAGAICIGEIWIPLQKKLSGQSSSAGSCGCGRRETSI
ncbi:hypothetical protein APTSU1_000535400 [Apodemus speciosus]|uniref:Uncharacterized protein n=1 Tax=Apodemus speciosus TaxID=105296 RepID=A0ABQ0ESU2_APOSI